MKYGFIGCGNMGGALIRAAAKSVSGEEIFLSDAFAEKRDALALEVGANVSDNKKIAMMCDYIVLGVKPQMMAQMLSEISDVLKNRKDRFVIVSMAAGLSTSKILSMAGGDYPIIRIMPNLPASVGEGMILYCTEGGVTFDEEKQFLSIMNKAGKLSKLDEKLIDAGSAVSGCGPAFVCLFAEALADGGVQCGLPRAKANEMALQTIMGTAKLLLENCEHPAVLKDAVCSPGGTTIVGGHALEEGGFRAAASNAVLAAYGKTLDLGK